jgi:hypothetical protein
MRRYTKVITSAERIGSRTYNPFSSAADKVKQFPPHHGNFTGIDPVGAKNRTTPTFRALKEIVVPFFHNLLVELTPTSQFAKNLATYCEILTINRP